jgi:hypothetical protein
MFFNKSEREKIKKAREEGFNLGVAKTKATYEKKIQKIKGFYASRIKRKNQELKEADKRIKKIEERAKFLDEKETVIRRAYTMASGQAFASAEEASKIFGLVDGTLNNLEIKKISHDKKSKKLEEEIEKHKQSKLKIAN